jgi:hypothetical protein
MQNHVTESISTDESTHLLLETMNESGFNPDHLFEEIKILAKRARSSVSRRR